MPEELIRELDVNLAKAKYEFMDHNYLSRSMPREIDTSGWPRTMNVVLIGKTGSGKSSTGNMLLQKECFRVDGSSSSVTKTTSANSFWYKGILIR